MREDTDCVMAVLNTTGRNRGGVLRIASTAKRDCVVILGVTHQLRTATPTSTRRVGSTLATPSDVDKSTTPVKRETARTSVSGDFGSAGRRSHKLLSSLTLKKESVLCRERRDRELTRDEYA
ncbi:hypothetical protein M758_UG170000 [Ceratodon purpureus]|nr:hypothetical protein M758_UG170000 [Ceratodon purpureus]